MATQPFSIPNTHRFSVPFLRRAWRYRETSTTYLSSSHEVTHPVSSSIKRLFPTSIGKCFLFLMSARPRADLMHKTDSQNHLKVAFQSCNEEIYSASRNKKHFPQAMNYSPELKVTGGKQCALLETEMLLHPLRKLLKCKKKIR